MKEVALAPGVVELSNDGELSLFFVGCGSAFSRTMNQNNLLVVKGEHHLLIDCGTKTPQALHELKIALTDLRNFLVTHTHADHIGGLEEVMMVNRYCTETGIKPRMIINEEFEDILWNHSLRGGSAYSQLRDGTPLGFDDYWDILRPIRINGTPREMWQLSLGDLDIKLPRTKHFPDNADSWQDSFWSCGVVLDERVLFTSDTRFDPDLLFELDGEYGLEMIFHDCQFYTGGVHASLEELATLPDEMKQKMVLMHYSDDWMQYAQQVEAAGFHSFARQNHRYTFR